MTRKILFANRNLLLFALMLALIAMACQLVTPDSQPDTEQILPSTTIQEEITPILASTPASEAELTAPALSPASDLVEKEATLINIYARVNPSVVNITTYQEIEGLADASSQGSGFVYDTDGHIITNAHVVHGSDQIDVAFADGTILSAERIGEDLHSDLAVLKTEKLPEGVLPAQLGNDNDLVVGQTVIAIGNPFGLGGTLTRGIVSALGRTIPALTSFSIPKAIQTDAAINPGNSGGPLLNLNGEVIGVNAQIQTDGFTRSNQGVGFAIPVSIVKRVVPDLIQHGEFDWSWLGVVGGDVTPEIALAMELPVQKGAYLSRIVSDGPASLANLQGDSGEETIRGRLTPVGGDVIIAIDGQPVQSFDDLLVYIALETTPGQEVTLTILRDGEQQNIKLTMDYRPAFIENLLQP